MGGCTVAMTAMQSVVAIFSAVFTPPDPTAATSIIRAVDLTELRAAVNTLRAQNGGLASFPFTDSTISVGSSVVRPRTSPSSARPWARPLATRGSRPRATPT